MWVDNKRQKSDCTVVKSTSHFHSQVSIISTNNLGLSDLICFWCFPHVQFLQKGWDLAEISKETTLVKCFGSWQFLDKQLMFFISGNI